MKYPCPHCSTVASRAYNLRTHLMGSRPRGGHELSRASAEEIVAHIESGGATSKTPLATADATAQAPSRELRRSGPLLRRGHWSSLALLEDARAVRGTLTAYESAIGHPVYLRPTDDGLTVISLDPAAPAMVGVGGSYNGACCIGALPPTASAVEAAARDYRAKIAGMTRRSVEERFVLTRIRRALGDGLRLRDDLLFLHQEWRFPGLDKIDILAIDVEHGHLVVVEAKKSEAAATRDRDKKGRTANEQAAAYAAQIALHAGDCSPFLVRLAAALAGVYRNGEGMPFDPNLPPRWEVWWPDGITVGPKETVTIKPITGRAGRENDTTFVASDAPWQRELRDRQSTWREAKGHPIGHHKGRPLGSRLAMPAAEEQLWNFLTPTIGGLVLKEYRANLERPRREQKLYGHPRLFEDLLSSQPLVFNLFGELALNLDCATQVARRLWPERVASVSGVEFEWSPGRWDARYLDNGTAADVAIFHTTPRGGTGVVFVETKYHEDLSGDDYELKPRYFAVARASGAFVDDHIDALTRGPLQNSVRSPPCTRYPRRRPPRERALRRGLPPDQTSDAATLSGATARRSPPREQRRSKRARSRSSWARFGAVIGEAWEREFRERYLARAVVSAETSREGSAGSRPNPGEV